MAGFCCSPTAHFHLESLLLAQGVAGGERTHCGQLAEDGSDHI